MRKVFYKSRIIFNLLTILSILLFSSQVCALNPGDNSPAFSLNSNRKTGEKISLSQFSGKIVYLDIWASWCGTCAESLSWMQKLQDKFGSDSFQVIAVNVDEERNAAEKILRKLESSILVAFDPEGITPAKYEVGGIPSSYLIGRDGKVIAIHEGIGKKEQDEIEQQIKKNLDT